MAPVVADATEAKPGDEGFFDSRRLKQTRFGYGVHDGDGKAGGPTSGPTEPVRRVRPVVEPPKDVALEAAEGAWAMMQRPAGAR